MSHPGSSRYSRCFGPLSLLWYVVVAPAASSAEACARGTAVLSLPFERSAQDERLNAFITKRAAEPQLTEDPDLKLLKSLVVLRLDGTKLRRGDGALSWLTLCKSLSILSLNRTDLRDTDLRSLADCKTLSELKLNDTALSGSFLEYCKTLSRLSNVGLRGNKRFLGSNLVHLQGHGALKILDLGGTDVSDECARVFPTLPQLRLLFLNDTRVSDCTLTEIAKLTELDALSLRNTSVSDLGVNLLMRLEELEFIDLSGTFVTSQCIEKLKKRFKGLDCVFAYGAKRLGV